MNNPSTNGRSGGSKKRDHPDRSSPSSFSPQADTEATTPSRHASGDGSGSGDSSGVGGIGIHNHKYGEATPYVHSHLLDNESIISLMDANSEAFSTANSDTASFLDDTASRVSALSTSEAGGIVERHIASRPIETADDFHYIAELLRNYENEDDLKRVAELLRTNKYKNQGKNANNLQNHHRHKKVKKSKKKKKKKRKKTIKEEVPFDEDECTHNDESFSVSSGGSSSGESSSSNSSTTSDTHKSAKISMNESNTSTYSSSTEDNYEQPPNRAKKSSKKEKRQKKAAEKAKKEKKKQKKQEKGAKEHFGDHKEEEIVLASNLPPTSVDVVHTTVAMVAEVGDGCAQSVSTATTNDASWAKAQERMDTTNDNQSNSGSGDNSSSNSSSDDDDDDGPRELFLDEDDSAPSSAGRPELPFPGMTVGTTRDMSVPEPPNASAPSTDDDSSTPNETRHSKGGITTGSEDSFAVSGDSFHNEEDSWEDQEADQRTGLPHQNDVNGRYGRAGALPTIFSSQVSSAPPSVHSTTYPPITEDLQLARQVSTEKTNLSHSTRNTSLVLARQTSNPLLNTALAMARESEGASTLSASVIRPATRNPSVLSARELSKQRRKNVAPVGHDLLTHSFHEAMEAAGAGGIQNPIHMPSNATSIGNGSPIKAELAVKPRLLCLHGWRSNAEITRLQLDNLGLLDFFDPIFIEGPHVSSEPADDAVNLLSQGPYFSWVDQVRNSEDGPDQKQTKKIISGLSYGGNTAGHEQYQKIVTDELMHSLKAIMVHLLTESQHLDTLTKSNSKVASIPCYDAVYGFSQGATLVTLLSYECVRNEVLEELKLPPMQHLPWKFVISACAANTELPEYLRRRYAFDYSAQIALPSIHVIGLSDLRLGQSQSIMKDYYDTKHAFPIYLDTGHGVPASTKKLDYILDEIINWFLLKITLRDVDVATVPLESESKNASMLHIMDEIDKIHKDQLGFRPNGDKDLDIGRLHLGKYAQYIVNTAESSRSTLIDMLELVDPKQTAFLAPEAKPLTYGKLLKFIRNDGDLRFVGVRKGFTVAYVAPFGVVSATAFITIASQCTAAPLDPGYSESEYMLAFEQLKPDIVITFDGVNSGLVHKTALGKGLRVAHATVKSGTCGLFKFENKVNRIDTDRYLVNHADGNGMILRTSGTTSLPKVVPLKMWAIVANSRVIAKNLGLEKTDIALNAMPLFHIGGLSANLLSSLAAGASVILMPKFNAEDFFDYLASPEEPRPTWYSAVPTMHAAIHHFSEDTIFKTSLRFMRTGAAAMPQDLALKMEKTFGCPMIITYSMTEQMPITHPPRGYSISRNKPNSVGQPVCASMCIVDKNLRPVLFSDAEEAREQVNGEVCISGPMLFEGYVANDNANAKSFFQMGGMDWFRTGDVGHLDRDGFLFLTGRSKELIKRGGYQVSPHEIEAAIHRHRDVKTAVVFAIPDPIWGEKVGAAVVLKPGINQKEDYLKKDLHRMLLADGLPQFKLPEEVLLVTENDLPKTRSNKYIRVGLAKKLGLDSRATNNKLKAMRSVNYHEAAVGVKFFLALAVTYVHIGNFDNRNLSDYSNDTSRQYEWEHTRSWCWHNPLFFLVGGFLLAAGTHMPVTNMRDLGNFYSLRIAALHPMYLVSILFCTINFAIRCTPSNFIPEFDRLREPLEGEYFVCQATPIEWSYGGTLAVSIISYACTLQSWPIMIPFSWFLSYYTWFSSVYIFCIFVFPWCHQQYHAVKDDILGIWQLNLFWLGMNYLYVAGISIFFLLDGDDAMQNYFALSTYIFPPGWVPCSALGVGCFYLFRHYRPNEQTSAWMWGAVTDIISLLLLAGWLFYGIDAAKSTPSFASENTLIKRHWDPLLSRILAPVGFLWFWGLAVGRGYTAKLFSLQIVVEWLAPASYNMFLFHQPISEWYYLITRGDWWAYPREFYWFSSHPFPVMVWEYFLLAGIVVWFSVIMEAYVNEFLVTKFFGLLNLITGGGFKRRQKDGESVIEVIQSIVKEVTYADVDRDTTLTEAGLSSMTTIILVSEIKKVYKILKLTVRDVINSNTIGDLVDLIEGRMKESAARPELALGKRTGVMAPKTLKNTIREGSSNLHELQDTGNVKSEKLSLGDLEPGGNSLRISGLSVDSSFDKSSRFLPPPAIPGKRSRRASYVLDSGTQRSSRRHVGAGATNGNPGNSNTNASAPLLERSISAEPPSRPHAALQRSKSVSHLVQGKASRISLSVSIPLPKSKRKNPIEEEENLLLGSSSHARLVAARKTGSDHKRKARPAFTRGNSTYIKPGR